MNARVPAAGVTVHYRFHPLAGRRARVVRVCRERHGTPVCVPGPDGAPLAVPAWMTRPEAKLLGPRERPRLCLEALAAVRALVQASLPTAGGAPEGDPHETSAS